MSPPTIAPPPGSLKTNATPLTSAGFAPFGSVIQRPPTTATTAATTVNQGTAQKHLQVSAFTSAPPPSGTPASFNINVFVCAPRHLEGEHKNVFRCRILERHPYTSQSFIPLGLDPDPGKAKSRYVVIVAPTLTSAPGSPPDLAGLRAFVCTGAQGVTYAAGTWHAPMVVLGERPVEFVVLVHENGVEGEDTQEVVIGEGGIGVVVREMGNGDYGLWAKAKF